MVKISVLAQSGADQSKYKSQEFIDKFNTVACSYPGNLGCIGNNIPISIDLLYRLYDVFTGGMGPNKYLPIGQTAAHGLDASVDDFAYSFAFFILYTIGETATFSVDMQRIQIISNFISSYGQIYPQKK